MIKWLIETLLKVFNRSDKNEMKAYEMSVYYRLIQNEDVTGFSIQTKSQGTRLEAQITMNTSNIIIKTPKVA